MDVISVDKEISNKVVKYFSVVMGRDHDIDDSSEVGDNDADSDMNVLQIRIEATNAKMLRVSISSTYDMINVALKCFQEFGTA